MSQPTLQLSGLIPAVFTPMHTDGEVHYEQIIHYASYLKYKGVTAVFVCGSTGEFSSLSVEERKKILEQWILAKHAGIITTVIAHIGHCNYRESMELARHADHAGADAIASVPPWYFPITDEEGLLETMDTIASSVSHKPFIYYHIPLFIQNKLNIANFMKKAAQSIPNIIGMKFSHADLGGMFECAQIQRPDKVKIQVFLGMDDLCLPAKSFGINAGIGTTYNFMIEYYQKIEEACRNNNLVQGQEYTKSAQQVLAVCMDSPRGIIAVFKSIMAFHGMDLGPPRLPLKKLNDDEIKLLKKKLCNIGLL